MALLALLAAPRLAAAGNTFLKMTSDPGDWIGGGSSYFLTPTDATFMITESSGVPLTVWLNGPSWWFLEFAPPGNGPLIPGIYENAGRAAFRSPARPGLDVAGIGRGCNALVGRFTVLELVRAPDGTISSFAADFEQHCELLPPALIGSIRYNSSFDASPRLSVNSAVRFEGDGEPNALSFLVSLSSRVAAPVSATFATSDGTATAGIDYAATSVTVIVPAGETSVVVEVPVYGNTVPQPGRSFAVALSDPVGATLAFGSASGTILDDDPVKTLLRLDGDDGDRMGGGKHVTLHPPLDGNLTVTGGATGLTVMFQEDLGGWGMEFAPPFGQTLSVGPYEGAARYPSLSEPGLFIWGSGPVCNTVTGRFDVLQADFGPSGEVLALAIDAEQHCEGASPALWVSLRVNSAIPIRKKLGAPRLAIAFGAPEIALGASTSLTFRLTNPNPQEGLTGVAVSDELPGGLVVSTPSGIVGSCGGAVSADPGAAVISLAEGTLAPGSGVRLFRERHGLYRGLHQRLRDAVGRGERPRRGVDGEHQGGPAAADALFRQRPR